MKNSAATGSLALAPAAAERPPAALRVLVVDDNPADRNYFSRLLNNQGFSVVAAGSAQECFEILNREPVQCVLLDYNLPRTDGIDVLTDIVADPLQRKIPVVMLTGEGSQNVAVDALKSGAADYLLKGEITESALRRAIDNAFEKSRLREAIERHAKDLEVSNKSLRRRNDEIQRFYHTISHEIKTPLAAAREFISLIQDEVAGPVTPEQDEYLQLSIECCDQLATHLNNLIDSTRLDNGKLTLSIEPFDVAPIARKACASAIANARDHGITIESEIDDDLPRALGDRDRITQVLCNLLNNAVKSSATGQAVTLSADRCGDRIVFAVADSGCGIDEGHLTHIFERLYQIPVTENDAGGLGLGLSISQELVRLHGSSIDVTSQVGKGSTFSFELSIAEEGDSKG